MLADKPKINLDKKPKFDLEKTPDTNFPIKRKQKQDIKKKSPFFPEIEEPQESLENLIGDFYTTPNTPADPTDCDRYPDSPWCGENPVDLTSPVGIELSIVLDSCNFGVQFSGTLGFIKVPPFQIVYRNPDCVLPPPEDPPVEEYSENVEVPDGDIWFIYPKKNYVLEEDIYNLGTGELDGWNEFITYNNITELEFPYTGIHRIFVNGIPAPVIPRWRVVLRRGTYSAFNGVYLRQQERANISNRVAEMQSDSRWSVSIADGLDSPNSEYVFNEIETFEYYGIETYRWQIVETLGSRSPIYIRDTKDDANRFFVNNKNRLFVDGRFTREIVWGINAIPFTPELDDIPTPPPPKFKKKECECMCNEDLLKLILKRIGSLPAKVPDNFTKQQPSMISIESLAELMLWQMQQLDALSGAYPIEIEIEDSDLVKEGNQKQKIKVPNQAEAIAELLGLILTIKRDTHATLITAIKAMGEAGMTKQLALKGLDVGLANAEFLGYKLEQKRKKMPSLFTPGGKDISETLQEKEVEIVSYENTDKKDLQDDLKTLLTMAARWNAQNWRKIDANNPKESLKNLLINNVEAVNNAGKEDSQDDFDNFTEQCERGFIDVSGISDTEKPWGRQYKERPKIREIGTDKNAGNNNNETGTGE